MQPINYSIDVGNPTEGFLKGVEQGIAIEDKGLKQQEVAVKLQKQQELNKDLSSLYTKETPTALDYVRLVTKYPELAEKLKGATQIVSGEQQQQKINAALQVTAALQAGRTDIATKLLEERETALRNSGQEEEANATAINRKMIEADPKFSKNTGFLMLAGTMGPEKFSEVYKTMLNEPGQAQKLETENANLPNKLALDNQNAFEDIETKKLNRQIAVLDAKIKGEANDIAREKLQLDRDDLSLKRDKLVTENKEKQDARVLDAQDKADTISTGLNTIAAIENSPLLKDTLFAKATGPGSLYRKISQFIPGSSAADFNALIEPLKNQQFLIQIKNLRNQNGSTGLGAMTEAEGKRLEQAIASLDQDQSQASFLTALNTIKKAFQKANAKVVGSELLPKTNASGGGTYVMTHPKYGVITESVVNSLLEKKPGMTREQALQFLKDTGGK